MALPASFLPARRHIAFIIGLALAVLVAARLEHMLDQNAGLSPELVPPSGQTPTPSRALTGDEQAIAKAAWAYFPANTRPTGLVDTVAGYNGTTMWDSGSALLGLLSARQLNVIAESEYQSRARQLLGALAGLPLFENQAPNKSYNTTSGQMTNYNNQPEPRGIGWSAIDLGRLATALVATGRLHPALAPDVDRVWRRWRLENVVQDGVMWGYSRGQNGDQRVQEGRVGYEQYGARGLMLLGRDPWSAYRPEQHLRLEQVQGVAVPGDDRTFQEAGAHVFVTSEPYVLLGLEYGLTGPEAVLARRLFDAQSARHQATGKLTAVSEDHLDGPPYFIYDTVWADGQDWACVTDTGEAHPEKRSLSAKAALGLAALFPGAYADQLRGAVQALALPGKGVQAGRYEADGKPNTALSVNTNAIVLEALAYTANGPVMTWRAP